MFGEDPSIGFAQKGDKMNTYVIITVKEQSNLSSSNLSINRTLKALTENLSQEFSETK